MARSLAPDEVVGYFFGHFIPAVWFTGSGLWWAYSEFRNYGRCLIADRYQSHHQNGGTSLFKPQSASSYRSRVWYPGPCFRKLPLESVLRLTVMTMGFLSQIYSCCYVKQIRAHPERLQHGVLFSGFAISGAIDVLISCGVLLVPGTDRVASMICYLIFYLIFTAHSHGEPPLETHLHIYYKYAAVGVILAHACEAAGNVLTNRGYLILALTRAYCQMMLGIVSLQIGITMYLPGGPWAHYWPMDGEASISMANTIVCFHLLVTFLFLGVMGSMVIRSQFALDRSGRMFSGNGLVSEKEGLLLVGETKNGSAGIA